MTPEDKLNALFAAERPKTPDYVFQAAVAQTMALRLALRPPRVLGVPMA